MGGGGGGGALPIGQTGSAQRDNHAAPLVDFQVYTLYLLWRGIPGRESYRRLGLRSLLSLCVCASFERLVGYFVCLSHGVTKSLNQSRVSLSAVQSLSQFQSPTSGYVFKHYDASFK